MEVTIKKFGVSSNGAWVLLTTQTPDADWGSTTRSAFITVEDVSKLTEGQVKMLDKQLYNAINWQP